MKPVAPAHVAALAAARLPGPHGDPFDRMLIAQAQLERAAGVTVDAVFGDDGVAVAW